MTLSELLRKAEEPGGGQREGVYLMMTPSERVLLKETAYASRTSQAGVLRRGLRLVAKRVVGSRTR